MINISFRGRQLQIPQRIEEIAKGTPYLRYLELAAMTPTDEVGRMAVRVKLLSFLLQLKTDLSLYPKDFIKEAMHRIRLTDPFIDGRGRLVTRTGTNMVPAYQGWKGPDDMLGDVDFGTFIDCETMLRAIRDTDDDDEHRRLQAEIFRKLYHTAERYPQESGSMPLLHAHAFTLFCNVTDIIRSEPVSINGRDIDFSILFKESPGETRPDDRTGWTGVALETAETGVFGSYYAVLKANLWDVLLFLYRKKFERMHDKTLNRFRE